MNSNTLHTKTSSAFSNKYEKIIVQAYKSNSLPKKTGKLGRPIKGKALCLIECLDHHKTEILRFMNDNNVPFDKNLTEQDLRIVKVRQKISGTFRNSDCANNYGRIRSYISTIKKQEKDAIKAFIESFTLDFREKPVFI